jgi:ribose transport system permease protein
MSEHVADPSGAEAADRPSPRDVLGRLLARDQPYMLYVAFVGLTVAFSLASPVFFTPENLQNIGRQTALVSIIAVGMTFVIVAGEIDLSVSSVLALSGMVAALAMQEVADNWIIAAAAGLGTGAIAGLLNGVLTTRIGIPSFLVTVGTLGIARGIALMVTGTEPVLITNTSYISLFGEGSFLGIPAPIAWTIVIALLGILVLHFGRFGRKVYAVGGNVVAARYSGINTVRVKTTVFVLTGMLAGFAALVLTARSHAARPDVAAGLELSVIAAVILGGTSLFGGRGTIVGAILGSIVIGILDNGLVLLGVSSSLQLVVKGVIIIAAVAFGRK